MPVKHESTHSSMHAVESAFADRWDAQVPQECDAQTGLMIGPELIDPAPACLPAKEVLEGRFCRLEPLDPERHTDDLFKAKTGPGAQQRFRYLPDNPPDSPEQLYRWIANASASVDPLFFAVIDMRESSPTFKQACGRQTLMRIQAEHQCIEIGNIYWGPAISQSPVTTEANLLFAEYVFKRLGYRRYEWKCDCLNQPSRAAALRFGFRYEGHFRRAVITKGRSRDTSWFSIIDEDWPGIRQAYLAWLDPQNFDEAGMQRQRLGDFLT